MKKLLGPLLILLAVAVIYAPILRHDFTNLDDPQTIAANPDFRPPSEEGLAHLWTTSAAGLYVPITYSVWWSVAQIAFHDGVMNPLPFHLLSVLLHAACGLAVWAILRRFGLSEFASTAGSLVFVVHPVQVETVAWASGAKDLLAGFFSLLAIWAWLRARCTKDTQRRNDAETQRDALVGGTDPTAFIDPAAKETNDPSAPGTRWGNQVSSASANQENPLSTSHADQGTAPVIGVWPVLTFVLLALAMLCKPVAVVTPLILASIDLIFFRRSLGQTARRLWPTLLLIVPITLIARSAQTIWPAVVTPLWTRPFIAGDALAFYLHKLAWPVSLTHLYGRTPMRVTAGLAMYWTWLLPTLLALCILGAARRRPAILAGSAIFVLALLPVLGFTPFEFQAHSTVADHYLYLPMFGIALAVAGLIDALQSDRPIDLTVSQSDPQAPANWLFPVATLVVMLLTVRSAWQQRHWFDSITLTRHAVAESPSADSVGAYGIALAEAGRAEEALPVFEELVLLSPTSRMAHLRLAQARLALKQYDRAALAAAQAVRLTTPADHDPLPRLFLADALLGLGRRDEARQQLQAAWQIDPGNPATLQRLDAIGSPATQP